MEKVFGKIKSLFSTPRRAILTIVITVFGVGILSVGAVFASFYWDMNEDRVEQAVIEKITPDPAADQQAVNDPAADQQAVNDQAADQQAVSDPATDQQAVNDPAANQQAVNDQTASVSPQESSAKISKEKAESIALTDAGLKKNQVQYLFSHFEMDDGYYQYDVRFINGQFEYEYSIDANSGAIIERDMDHVYD